MNNIANFLHYWSVPSPTLPQSLTFTGKSATNAVCLSTYGSPDAVILSTNKNGGQWTAYTTGTIIELASGDTLAISGANDHFSKDLNNRYIFAMTGTIQAAGNIQSLMNFSDSCTNTCYYRLFSNCTSLTQTPQLPATTLAASCYRAMFSGCTGLNSTPILPALTAVDQCYRDMFYGCTSLTDAPQLPATTLYTRCYYCMFFGCTNLSSISVNFTDWTQATNATTNWLALVAANGTFICPTALNTTTRDFSHVPTNWNVVNPQ